MNYKLLSILVFIFCAQTSAKADVAKADVAKAGVATAPESTKIATDLKIGYVDMHYVMENFPEAKKARVDLEAFQKQRHKDFESHYKELQEKVEAFQKEKDTLTQAQQKQRYAEISKLETATQEMQAGLQEEVYNRVRAVMEPIQNRVQEVIRKIAEEGAYTFVFSKALQAIPGDPIMLFAKESFDLSKLIVEKLQTMAPVVAKPPVVGAKKDSVAAAPKSTASKKK